MAQKKKEDAHSKFSLVKCIELDLIILDFVRTCVFVLLFLLAKSNMPIALCRRSIICYLTLFFSRAGGFELTH